MSSLVIAGDTSGTVTLQAPAAAGSTVITLPSTSGNLVATGTTGQVTQTMLSTNVAGNGPAFSAYQSSAQTLTTGVWTKLQFQAEEFDTNNNFDSTTNYRFTPTVAGYYQISGGFIITTISASLLTQVYKNGSAFKRTSYLSGSQVGTYGSVLVYLNGSTDYVELYGYSSATNGTSASSVDTYFQAALVRAA
jgi:Flp pilus assembly protein TadG